jgi:hypothetical protein
MSPDCGVDMMVIMPVLRRSCSYCLGFVRNSHQHGLFTSPTGSPVADPTVRESRTAGVRLQLLLTGARGGCANAAAQGLNDLPRYTSGTHANRKRPCSANTGQHQNSRRIRAPALLTVSRNAGDYRCRTARLARDSPSVWSFRHAAAHAQRDLGLIVAQGLEVQDHDCGARTAGPRKGGARSPPVRRRH